MVSERVKRQIDGLLDEAEEALPQYEWDAVRQRAQPVLALDPDDAD